PSNTSVARAPRARQNAATRRTTSPRLSSSSRGPPHEPSRLLPSIRYGIAGRRVAALDADQLSQEAPPLVHLAQEELLQLAGVHVQTLAERAAVDQDAVDGPLLHVVPALGTLHEVQLLEPSVLLCLLRGCLLAQALVARRAGGLDELLLVQEKPLVLACPVAFHQGNPPRRQSSDLSKPLSNDRTLVVSC